MHEEKHSYHRKSWKSFSSKNLNPTAGVSEIWIQRKFSNKSYRHEIKISMGHFAQLKFVAEWSYTNDSRIMLVVSKKNIHV